MKIELENWLIQQVVFCREQSTSLLSHKDDHVRELAEELFERAA